MKQRGGGPNAQQAPRIAAYAHAGGKTVLLDFGSSNFL